MSFGFPTRPLASRSPLATWLIAAASLATFVAGCGPAPAPTPPVATVAKAARAAPVKAGVEVLWQQRSNSGSPPEIAYLSANSKGDVFFATQPADTTRLVRLDAAKQLAWEAKVSGGDLVPDGVALDEQGNAYFTARVGPSVALDGKALDGPGEASVLLLKLAPDGKKLWHHILKGSEVTTPSLALSPKGSVLLAGGFAEDLVLGPDLLHGGGASAGYGFTERNLFLAEVEPGGRILWGREYPGQAMVSGIATDPKGYVVLWGIFGDSVTFNNNSPMRARGRERDRSSFVAKLDASGKYRWQRQITAAHLATSGDGSGDVYLCDRDSKTQDLVKIGDGGQVVSRWPMDDPSVSKWCGPLASDDKGNVYVFGGVERSDGDGPRHRILRMAPNGTVLDTFDLSPNIAPYMTPSKLVWAGGHLYLSAVKGLSDAVASVLLDVTM